MSKIYSLGQAALPRYLFLIPFFITISHSLAHAQAVNSLPPVVVTASRIEQPQTDALLHTTIISAEDIKNNSGLDLPSLLAREAGLQITQSGGLGQPVSMFMRGQSSNHTLVLIDGVPFGQQAFSTTPALEHILLSQIESIEIVRGNASAIYGSGAIGGVIQIFTKKPGEKTVTGFTTEIGSASTKSFGLSRSGKIDNLSYSFSVGGIGSNGISANNIVQYPAENPDRDDYRNKSITGLVSNEWDKGQVLGVRLYANDANYKFDGSGFGTVNDNTFGQTRQNSFSIFSKNQVKSNWGSTLTLSQSNIVSKSQNINKVDPFAFEYILSDKTKITQIQWQNDFLVYENWQLIAGGSIGRQKLNSFADFNSIPDTQYSRSAGNIFSGLNGKIGRHQLQINARYDRVGDSGSDTTGYFGYGYALTPELKLTASASSAFNAPTLARLYDLSSGNTELKSETSTTYEAGFQYSIKDTLIRLVGFQTNTKNQFAKDPACTNPFSCKTINLTSASNQGVEISTTSFWDKTNLKASLTLQNPVDDETKKILDRNARVYGAISVAHTLESWRLGADLIFAGTRNDQDYVALVEKNLSAYSKVNLTARKKISNELSVYARIENLLDREYQTSYGYNQLPRSIFVGLNWQQ